MKPFTHRLISSAFLCLFISVILIIYMKNTGIENAIFDFVISLPYGDKIGHVCLFGLLTFLAIVSSKFSTFEFGRLKVYTASALVTLLIVCEECSQAFIPNRTFDVYDLLANILGITIAIAAAYGMRLSLRKKRLLKT